MFSPLLKLTIEASSVNAYPSSPDFRSVVFHLNSDIIPGLLLVEGSGNQLFLEKEFNLLRGQSLSRLIDFLPTTTPDLELVIVFFPLPELLVYKWHTGQRSSSQPRRQVIIHLLSVKQLL